LPFLQSACFQKGQRRGITLIYSYSSENEGRWFLDAFYGSGILYLIHKTAVYMGTLLFSNFDVAYEDFSPLLC
jgi:hypothetical protein